MSSSSVATSESREQSGGGLDGAAASRLEAALEAAGVDGVIVFGDSSRDSDIAPFVGPVHLGECFVVASATGRCALGFATDMEREQAAASGLELLTPEALGLAERVRTTATVGELWSQTFTRAFELLDLAPGRWAVAGHPPAGTLVEVCAALSAEGWQWVSGSEILRRWRRFKPESWRRRFELPAEGVCAAMRGIAQELCAAEIRNGELWLAGSRLTAGRLRQVVRHELGAFELEEPEGNIFASGGHGGVPHNIGDSRRVLRAGEPLVVDLFPRGELFADCTRTFCVGEPSTAFVEAHATVLAALQLAHEQCAPGVTGWALQQRVCDLFEAEGYETARRTPGSRHGYVHGLGHGVGYELHEYPSFREMAGGEGVLEVGDLLTLEPGLYDVDAGYGVRLEDLCYLGPQGVENLTPLPYSWDPRSW